MTVTTYISAVLAFVVATALVFVLRPIATKLGLVDVPNERKDHEGEIPLVGGISIFVAVIFTYGVSRLVFPGGEAPEGLAVLFLAGFILVVAGMIDDYRGLTPGPRIVVEIVAALIMIYGAGVVVTDLGTMSIGSNSVTLGIAAVPFTVFATVALINAVNMTDGLDGLAGSLTVIPMIGFVVAELMFGSGHNILHLVIFAASIVAFLLFNVTVPGKRRALIFLGDSGSMLLGFVLAWFAISLSQGEDRVITPAAALWFLTLPVFDTVCMTSRRIMRRQRPFAADKEHLHHVFLLAGFTVTETVATMAGLATIGVLVGLLGTLFQVSDLVLAGSFLVLGLLYFWVILRSWAVMRFLRRSICRRRAMADRRTSAERRRGGQGTYTGVEKRKNRDRRRKERRQTDRTPASSSDSSA